MNYRVAEQLAIFGRYSRGGRASADKILFTPAVNYDTGKLVDPDSAYDTVKQAELGLKYRVAGMTFNVTGFSAKTAERNVQINSKADGSIQAENIVRGYKAKGVELEAACSPRSVQRHRGRDLHGREDRQRRVPPGLHRQQAAPPGRSDLLR
ncbi:TonB-dependent receptor [Caulobacter segnis]